MSRTAVLLALFCAACFALAYLSYGDSRAQSQKAESCCERAARYNLLLEDLVRSYASTQPREPEALLRSMIEIIYDVPPDAAARMARQVAAELENTDGL